MKSVSFPLIGRLALAAAAGLWGLARASAASLFGEARVFLQPDGEPVTLILHGDEFYLRAETTDGYTVIRDPETGWICYAELSADGTALVSTGRPCRGDAAVRSGEADPAPARVQSPESLSRARRFSEKRE